MSAYMPEVRMLSESTLVQAASGAEIETAKTSPSLVTRTSLIEVQDTSKRLPLAAVAVTAPS
jgi:hypothetical protein